MKIQNAFPAAALAVIIAASCQNSTSQTDTTLYCNGDIITMTEPLYAEALLVKGDSIEAVGKLEDLKKLAPAHTKMTDLQGKTLLPSFIDPHSHFSGYATSLLEAKLDNAENLNDIAQAIRKFINTDKVEKGKWVVAGGYDNSTLEEGSNPSLEFLDSICPDNPLMIKHKSGHSGLANSLALKELGITYTTPDPKGGLIGRQNGKLTGYLEENAFIENVTKIPMAKMDDYIRAFKAIQEKYASYGITTVQEGLMVEELGGFYKYLKDNNLLYLDVVAYVDIRNSGKTMSEFADCQNKYVNHLKIGGYKIILDGSPQGRTAWMLDPYADSKDYRGYPAYTDDKLQECVTKVLSEHRQLLAHCNGDAASLQFINAYSHCLNKFPDLAKTRPVIIHAQFLPAQQMGKARDLGMIASFFTAHTWYWGDVHIKNFGLERASRISSARSAIDSSLIYTFHQDSPVIDADMIETLWCATNRITKGGVLLGPDQKISVLDALKGITINAAYQYFEENEKGSLEKGKKADLVILSKDPLKIPAEDLKTIKVLQTIKDGKVIYRNPQ